MKQLVIAQVSGIFAVPANASADAAAGSVCAPRLRRYGRLDRSSHAKLALVLNANGAHHRGVASSNSQLDLSTVPVARRPVARLAQLSVGLVLYGVSMAAMVRARLGLDPWDVLHQGLARHLGWGFGLVVGAVGVLVLLAWVPLRQRPGIGTVANVVVISVAVDRALAWLPAPDALAWRIVLLCSGVALNAFATACYVGARLGPGPRDGLMTGLHARTGRSVRTVRTTLEVLVLAVGWLLGGSLGVGTVLYAVLIGPLAQLFLPWVAYRGRPEVALCAPA